MKPVEFQCEYGISLTTHHLGSLWRTRDLFLLTRLLRYGPLRHRALNESLAQEERGRRMPLSLYQRHHYLSLV